MLETALADRPLRVDEMRKKTATATATKGSAAKRASEPSLQWVIETRDRLEP
jgi:hypothetical protein